MNQPVRMGTPRRAPYLETVVRVLHEKRSREMYGAMRRLGIFVLLVGCGSGGGVGDDAEVPVDAAVLDVTVETGSGQDSGQPQQDATVGEDATLDVNLPDSYWTADSGGGPADTGVDTGNACAPDGILCVGSTAEICKSGTLTTQLCTGSDICADGYGCVLCDPGAGSCSGSTGTLCNSTGTGYITSNCDSELGLKCQAGVCVGDCANVGLSYIGCEYYAVTALNNLLDQGVFSFAVSIANSGTKNATVYITGPHTVTGSPFTINAGTIQTITLPWEAALSCGTGTCNGSTTTPPGTEIDTGGAYHIKSNEPVTAYQFNALNYEVGVKCSAGNPNGTTSPLCYSYTNDASLLIPVNALTGNYYVASYPAWYIEPGIIDIVGTQASTSVTITSPVTITSGAGLSGTGGTVTIGAGDVIQITNPTLTTETYGTDMSGTQISATEPVEVFGGHGCTYVPSSTPACDHIEQVMFPKETLGSDYLIVPPNMTGIVSGSPKKNPTHIVHILGTVASTSLTYQPTPNVISGSAAGTVGAGGVVTFETDTPFHLTATNAVLVSMTMESSNNFGGGVLNGDPSMSVDVPTAQFRDNYAFTAPASYYINWATVIAPTGNTVTIDTTTIPATSFTAIGLSGYGYYHYKICDNSTATTCTSVSANHTATSAGTFGIQVYGYGSYTSYWYPGGLNLTR
jgi:IgGFc binding protein